MPEGYAALRRGAAWLDLAARGRILTRGRDRARLLHNITTNEVKKMAPGEGCYAFLLSPQGRIQADLLLFCFEDRFLIDDQVELEDVSPQTGEIGLEGPGAEAVLAALGAPVPASDYSHLAWKDSTIARASLTGQPGFRIFCPADAAGDLIQALESAGVTPATAEDARVVRIENGQPRYARGHVNRKLERIELAGADPPPPGTVVEAGGKQAEIASSAYSPDADRVVALAYVRE